jgi:hypothetical protein
MRRRERNTKSNDMFFVSVFYHHIRLISLY